MVMPTPQGCTSTQVGSWGQGSRLSPSVTYVLAQMTFSLLSTLDAPGPVIWGDLGCGTESKPAERIQVPCLDKARQRMVWEDKVNTLGSSAFIATRTQGEP